MTPKEQNFNGLNAKYQKAISLNEDAVLSSRKDHPMPGADRRSP